MINDIDPYELGGPWQLAANYGHWCVLTLVNTRAPWNLFYFFPDSVFFFRNLSCSVNSASRLRGPRQHERVCLQQSSLSVSSEARQGARKWNQNLAPYFFFCLVGVKKRLRKSPIFINCIHILANSTLFFMLQLIPFPSSDRTIPSVFRIVWLKGPSWTPVSSSENCKSLEANVQFTNGWRN